MKKVLLSLVAFVVLIANVNAQETSFGIKAGPNFANLVGDAEGDMRVGFHVGGVANLMISSKFAIAPELLYSLQGTKEDFGDETVNFNLSYLNIPIMAKFYITEGFNIHAGPYVGFLLAAKFKNDDEELDIKDEMNTLDFGIGFGAGYELENGLNFGVRYNQGLANTYDSEDGFDDDIAVNSVIQLSVGFNF